GRRVSKGPTNGRHPLRISHKPVLGDAAYAARSARTDYCYREYKPVRPEEAPPGAVSKGLTERASLPPPRSERTEISGLAPPRRRFLNVERDLQTAADDEDGDVNADQEEIDLGHAARGEFEHIDDQQDQSHALQNIG